MSGGTLIGIARHERPRAPLEELGSVRISLEHGVEGDCRGLRPERQVTIVALEDWSEACKALGRDVPWTARRANLLVEGIAGFKHVGARLQVGSVLLEVTEENEPCRIMDLQSEGLRIALQPNWRAGIACKVLTPGELAIGDRVVVVEREAHAKA